MNSRNLFGKTGITFMAVLVFFCLAISSVWAGVVYVPHRDEPAVKKEILDVDKEVINSRIEFYRGHLFLIGNGLALSGVPLEDIKLAYFLESESITRDQNQQQQDRPRIEVAFLVDTTGSMGDEIAVVKNEINNMINKISSGQPVPIVRYAVIAFRDNGDSYVTKKFDFSVEKKEVQNCINQLEASGGGDKPEAVDEAMKVAINQLQWSQSPEVIRMMFIIGDAGSHSDNNLNTASLARQAAQKGISIITIGCSGMSGNEVEEFSEISRLTNGTFEFLTYQRVVVVGGEERRYLKAGEKTYEITGGDKDTWKMGSEEVVKKGLAREVSSEPVVAGAAPEMDTTYDSVAGSSATRRTVKSDMSAPSASMTNNLDSLVIKHVKKKAEEKGVTYEEK
ncbi:MAG: vWA domain-containing protein [Vulcanimicrobiota bacterium]